MSNRYAPLPNSRSDHDAQAHEMQAAFDYSDDDEDDDSGHNATESHPLNPTPTSPAFVRIPSVQQHIPGTYDFENLDYDYPPPGSPPRPSAVALPNEHGNSNGLVPSFDSDSSPGPSRGWFNRAAAVVLPSHYVHRFGLLPQLPAGAIGGGTNNDGVFANVTAKPTRPVRIQEGDDTYIVPEDTRQEAPPSYASAQADAVPPYWETTVHAPFSPDSIGEMIIDSLPTGSLFSFLWNMLVSVSFQFVGFLLTYLLHTTHAARLGSRAGLGVTLIQYGFALRSRIDGMGGDGDGQGSGTGWSGWAADPQPTFGTAAEADAYYGHLGAGDNSTMLSGATLTEEQANMLVADATTEWLSFFLMTVGWFILLTSLLGFWRVKRWERGILASQRETSPPVEQPAPGFAIVSQIEGVFGLRGVSRSDLFRQGFGFGRGRGRGRNGVEENAEEMVTRSVIRAEEGEARHASETQPTVTAASAPAPSNDPVRASLIAQALARERRLQQELSAAGLL